MIRRADRVLQGIAGVGLLAMMAVTCVDVVGRYFVGRPIPGAFEITELLLVAVIFCGLPLASSDAAQVEVDLLAGRLPPRLWSALGRVGHGACAAAFAGVAWVASAKALRMSDDAEVTPTLGIALAPFAWLVVAMVAVAAVIELARALRPGPER